MNEQRRLHPFYIVFSVTKTLKGLFPLLLIVGINKVKEWGIGWFVLGFFLLTGLFIMTVGLAGWRRFTYTLEADRLVIRKGIWFRDELSLYFGRIHSVNIEQSFLQRILGIAQVKIETPGGKTDSDGVLPSLSLEAAERLKEMLRRDPRPGSAGKEAQGITQMEENGAVTHESKAKFSPPKSEALVSLLAEDDTNGEKETAVLGFSAKQLAFAAMSTINVGLVIAFFAGIYSFADDFIPNWLYDSVYEGAASLVPSYLSILVWSLIIVLFSWFLSAALYVLKYYGFSVARRGRGLTVSYGLLEKKMHQFPVDRIQAVTIQEGVIRQLFGYAKVELSVLSSMKQEKIVLHPFVKVTDLPEVLGAFIPLFRVEEIESRPPRRAFLYFIRIEMTIALLICGTLFIVIGAFALWSLCLLPLVLLWCLFRFLDEGMTLRSGQLTTRVRLFARYTSYIRKPQIVAMIVSGTTFQRRKRLLTLTATNLLNENKVVSCIDERQIRDVWRWYSHVKGKHEGEAELDNTRLKRLTE
ncbi:MAG: PH domain-containing protein [Gorillibacterium sp.]|nr:PH domain-containing protein [Gorillibacterium sp.]